MEKDRLFTCPQCKLKVDIKKTLRCPRCNVLLLQAGCDGKCSKCAANCK